MSARTSESKAQQYADEVDAIGKARGLGGGDSGTAEREQGLLQLLCEMDGFRQNDRVLVIGATNMCAGPLNFLPAAELILGAASVNRSSLIARDASPMCNSTADTAHANWIFQMNGCGSPLCSRISMHDLLRHGHAAGRALLTTRCCGRGASTARSTWATPRSRTGSASCRSTRGTSPSTAPTTTRCSKRCAKPVSSRGPHTTKHPTPGVTVASLCTATTIASRCRQSVWSAPCSWGVLPDRPGLRGN